MSYYQVLFGLLFASTCQSLAHWYFDPDPWPWQRCAGLLVVATLVVNDLIATSIYLEDETKGTPLRYKSLWPKLIDLVNFALLSVALYACDPRLLDSVPGSTPAAWSESGRARWTLLWACVGAYWILVMAWSKLTKWYETYGIPRPQIVLSGFVVAFSFCASLLSLLGRDDAARLAGFLAALWVPMYLIVIQSAFLPTRRASRARRTRQQAET